MKIGRRREKAALPVLEEARPHSVKATGQLLEGSGPEPAWSLALGSATTVIF